MKLKLNASQLSFLAFVQIQDDWHYSAFANTIIDNYKDKFSGNDAAFEQMRQELLNLSEEKHQIFAEIVSPQMLEEIFGKFVKRQNPFIVFIQKYPI